MDLNITLIGQMITFAVFVWFTMKFVWPPLMSVMEERRKQVADGLAAAERGHQELEQAKQTIKAQLDDTKAQSAAIIDQANQRANHIVEEAKGKAREEGERLIGLAKGEIEQQYNAAREDLMFNVSRMAVAGAERILKREIDAKGSDELVADLVKEI